VTSPYLPITLPHEANKLAEAKARLSQEQTRIELFEVGTGNLAYKLDMRMAIKHFAWSYCGRFLSTCGTQANSSTRLSVLPNSMQEQILNMIDALKFDKHFWLKFSIDLRQINMQNRADVSAHTAE